eukprot:TRINITY_DN2499_c0_g1_i2.p2 TRINITY_DN2499_c0_g1~~TRINITY_DN2499_c0_g1_i2.p2  ORF type:complete len:63 (+),score=7.49 TRINITY_DN2499_c0_g1_i2:174-362(+)
MKSARSNVGSPFDQYSSNSAPKENNTQRPHVPAIDEHKVKKWTFSIFATPRCQEIMSAEPKT